MLILGIDPGTAKLGWGLIKMQNAKCKMPARNGYAIGVAGGQNYGCIETPAGEKPEKRLKEIYQRLCDIIKKEKPEAVALEELFFFKNQKTAIRVAEARGVVLLAAAKHKLPVFSYTPLQVKQALVGYGRAEKHQIQQMLKAILGLKEIPRPDDAADALAIAVCHGQTNQSLNPKYKASNNK